MQEKSNRSKIKAIVLVTLVVLFSLTMLICSFVQISKINQLNDKIAQQERQIDELNKQLENL